MMDFYINLKRIYLNQQSSDFSRKIQKDCIINSISPQMEIKKSLGGFKSAKSLKQYLRPYNKEKNYTYVSETERKYQNIKICPIQQYFQQRFQSLSPHQKSFVDFSSSPDPPYYPAKSSTHELGSNNRKLQNCYNQSLQLKLNNLNI